VNLASHRTSVSRWALHRLNDLVTRVREAYEGYAFHVATQAIHLFSAVTLSSLYLDILKDRLYTSPPDAPLRRSAQTAMRHILSAITRLMAPILCFTAEEVWQALLGRKEGSAIERSVHAEEFPVPLSLPDDPGLEERWERLLAVREEVLKALEIVRSRGEIGNALEALVTLEAGPDLEPLLERYAADLPGLFLVSRVRLGTVADPTHATAGAAGLRIGIAKAEGTRCERCWNVTLDVGCEAALPTVCGRCARAIRSIRGGEEARP
jgi:isoleucyl-tRNA synthetase